MLLSLGLDLRAEKADWFARSGALAVLASGIVAYKSLSRHYVKFFNNMRLNRAVLTSRNQAFVDGATLVLSIIGTGVWAYGDKLIQYLTHGAAQ